MTPNKLAKVFAVFAQAGWMPQWINMLSWWQWMILAAVPPAIILLYFLKLKRRPLEVPSTYLWHRSIEDLHVNAIWQRLRRNLLLFLQLLLIFLAMLAVLRPGWRGAKVSGDRFIFLVDNSASMQASDAGPSRLEEAKRLALEKIDQMGARDAAMIVSFSDSARIEQMFTHNRGRLRRSLESIRPTERATSLAEALKVAGGLANPGRTSEDPNDVQVAEPMPATVFILSDGKFPAASDFRLGNLEPVYMSIGSSEATNVGILAFSVGRHVADPGLLQAFARLGNFRTRAASVSVELRLDGRLIDADEVTIAPGDTQRLAFDLAVVESGVLELRITSGDDLKCDDVAWTAVNPPRRSKVLIVTPGDEFLDFAFATDAVRELADVSFQSPDFLDNKEYQRPASTGAYDLVVYDRCRPHKMPQANTLWLGAIPPAETRDQDEAPPEEGTEQAKPETKQAPKPEAKQPPAKTEGEAERPGGGAWGAGPKIGSAAIIIDTDTTHPLMQWIDMGDVELYEPTPLELPPGGTALVDVQWMGGDGRSHVGPVFAVAPREGFEDAVMGFVLMDQQAGDDGATQTVFGTNWPIRPSFPVFVLNLLHYLGSTQAAMEGASFTPGEPVNLESPVPGKPIEVRTPGGRTVRLKESRPGKFQFTGTTELGVYEVRSGGKTLQHFAVNLFHPMESDIRPNAKIQIGRGVPVAGETVGWETARRELWKWILLAGLGVLLIEWYVYNRRVYL